MGLRTIEDNRVAETVAANKKFFWVFCLVGLLLVGAGILSLRLDKTIAATGVVMAAEERYVFAPSSGILGRHFVRIGETVEAGTRLFSLEREEVDLRILEKKRELLDVQSEIAAVELALDKAEIRPADLAMLTAQPRLDVLREIQEIHRNMMAAWDRVEGERAIRGLEYELQRVASLRTRIEALDSRMLAEWQEAGFPELERKGLERKRKGLREVREVLENELELLEGQREGLDVVSPIAGTVIDIYHRYPGMGVREGERVLKVANVEDGYRVRAFVGDRNIDLLGAGIPARMESRVFDSMFEGYVTGTVERIVGEADWDSRGGEKPGYEVTVEVEETPYPLVLGSRMKIDFLLGRQSLLALITNRPDGEREQYDGDESD